MHPFHRVVRHKQSNVTTSKQSRDIKTNVDYGDREEDELDEDSMNDKSRKTSPNRRKQLLDARYAECVQMSAAATPTEWQPNKSNNALKARETILWPNSNREWDDNGKGWDQIKIT